MYKGKFWIMILIVLLFIPACSNSRDLPFVPLEKTTNVTQEKQEQIPDQALQVAIASVVSPLETRAMYEELIKYFEKKLNKPLVVVQRGNYAEVNEMIKNKQVDLAFICSLSYFKGKESGYMRGIGAPEVNGKSLYRSYIIVHKSTDYQTLGQLKGKRFAFTDPDSYSGRLAVLDLLKLDEKAVDNYFGETFLTYSHDYSVSAVAHGVVDGAAVDSLVFDQMKLLGNEDAKNVKIIDYGKWIGSPPVVVSNSVTNELRLTLEKVLLEMDRDEEGKRILANLGITRFTPIDDQQYQPIKQILQSVGKN
ncbi:phosphate/phosphite/phosphonate ABC transporter substrate-binding protein [Brevibacillus sp. SYSU BS000544]|uniref:substrate-binding domain-containing protein n=1 Tax=Brevibacillus sp. SYSU BS000544 TaxID=3416443 RepID=UPI003CE47926